MYDIESRNLGYYSTLQTDITYLFKANIIDWIQNNDKIMTDNIPLLKEAFMSGFSNGYSHKQKVRSEDQLQK